MYKIKDNMNAKLIHPCIGSYKSLVFPVIRCYQIRPQPADTDLPFCPSRVHEMTLTVMSDPRNFCLRSAGDSGHRKWVKNEVRK